MISPARVIEFTGARLAIPLTVAFPAATGGGADVCLACAEEVAVVEAAAGDGEGVGAVAEVALPDPGEWLYGS